MPSITGALKNKLIPEHMLNRVLFACEKLEPDHLMFDGFFYDTVHVGENWFFLSEGQMQIYVSVCATRPVTTETTLSSKVMFLCASIARPRYNANGECLFDGKIGMWPFIERVEAVRASMQRPIRETMVTKPVSVSNKAKHRESMLQHIIPSIKEKWPHRGDRNIVMQQDGASAHATYLL
jgi:hypothetical protein